MHQLKQLALGMAIFALSVASAGCAHHGQAGATPTDDAPRLYVVRHAEAWLNLSESDRPAGLVGEALEQLTTRGEDQANEAARQLASTPGRIVRVVTSPAGRAAHTARIIANRLALADEPSVDERWAKMGDREAISAAASRASDAANDALAVLGPGQAAVVVSHGDVIPALIGEALGTPEEQRFDRHGVAKGSITTLWLDAGGRWRVAPPPTGP